MFKQVTEKDVTDKFLQLIEENGTTTTMDVKKALRNDGFWVFQRTVSNILHEAFVGLGIAREFAGEYCIYYKPETIDINITEDNTTEDDEDGEDSTLDANIVKRAKVISDLKMIADDTYQLTILVDGTTVDLVVTTNEFLGMCGDLAYNVFDNTGRDWYVFSTNKNLITRHRAIYYVWLVASKEYDGFIKYADLRSKRMW